MARRREENARHFASLISYPHVASPSASNAAASAATARGTETTPSTAAEASVAEGTTTTTKKKRPIGNSNKDDKDDDAADPACHPSGEGGSRRRGCAGVSAVENCKKKAKANPDDECRDFHEG